MIKKPGKKKSKKLFVFLVCIGLALMAAGIIAGFCIDDDSLSGRLIGFGGGFGSAIAAVGAVNYILVGRKPDAVKQQEINEKDERLIKIREKSAMDTWYATLIACCVAEGVCLLLDFMTTMFIILGIMSVHTISYFVFLYRNSNKF